ncbi:hypothetical protein AAG570_009074 [Ranatra chinensis]|uniref:Uncharacterized protein n=1 Tax=Ranatra chinensis TaxID=642074 RepID=A0ABD0ZDX5_9HEMI
MGSKRRNMFHKNKTQETTENEKPPIGALPDGEYTKKGRYSTRSESLDLLSSSQLLAQDCIIWCSYDVTRKKAKGHQRAQRKEYHARSKIVYNPEVSPTHIDDLNRSAFGRLKAPVKFGLSQCIKSSFTDIDSRRVSLQLATAIFYTAEDATGRRALVLSNKNYHVHKEDFTSLLLHPSRIELPVCDGPASPSSPWSGIGLSSIPKFVVIRSSWTHAYPSRIQRTLDLTTHCCSHSTTLRGSPPVACDLCNLIPNSLQTPLIPRQVTDLETVEKRVRGQLQERRARQAMAGGRAPGWVSWRNPGLSRQYGDYGTSTAKTALSGYICWERNTGMDCGHFKHEPILAVDEKSIVGHRGLFDAI